MEYFRTDDSGRIDDTQDRLSARGSRFGSSGGDGSAAFSGVPVVVRPTRSPNGFRASSGGSPFFGDDARPSRPPGDRGAPPAIAGD